MGLRILEKEAITKDQGGLEEEDLENQTEDMSISESPEWLGQDEVRKHLTYFRNHGVIKLLEAV